MSNATQQPQKTAEEIAAEARARMLQQEATLPIDIHYHKFLDWLVDRKRIPEQWKKSLEQIQSQVKLALVETPEYQNVQMDYFYALQIRDLLKLSEGQKKDFFGRYSSKRMKDWDDVIRAYEANHIFLGEAAQYLVQQVTYEIPAMKKTIQRQLATRGEMDKRIAETHRHVQEFRDAYSRECKKLRIEGKDLQAEVHALSSQLPDTFSQIMETINHKDFQETIQYYIEFSTYNQSVVSDQVQSAESQGSLLPLITYLTRNGNTGMATYYGMEEPVDETSNQINSTSAIEEPKIDWDIGFDTTSSTDNTPNTDNQNSIDWDVDVVHVNPDLGVEVLADGTEDNSGISIDWDISDVADDPSAVKIDWDVGEISMDASSHTEEENHVHGNSLPSGIAPTRETILEFSLTRSQFLNELLELEGFLRQRLDELGEVHHCDIVHQLFNAPPLVQNQTTDRMATYIQLVEKLLDFTNGPRTRQLLLIKSSKKYVARLCQSLQMKLDVAKKLESSIPQMEKKKRDALAGIEQTTPLMEAAIKRTKEVQHKVEDVLSKLYNGRKVHIIGEINTI
eukprot:TRINITY_DN1118_c0_g2_i1.p1 TRINITY_DN1118_c0_g2~~TRINITY_DN1118_c0_g2_i1.p1  ORF type:complete len:565 (+),score=146.07 TRINITY_DN1118_c0_g2_i1:72-1766(+)